MKHISKISKLSAFTFEKLRELSKSRSFFLAMQKISLDICSEALQLFHHRFVTNNADEHEGFVP